MSDFYKIGIIVADSDEFAPLEQMSEILCATREDAFGHKILKFTIESGSKSAQVCAILSGIGKVNAATAAAFLATRGCDIIINYGLSGGISGVRRGDICLPDKFLEHDFDLTGLGYAPCEKPGQEYIYNADSELLDLFTEIVPTAKRGTAVSGDSFVTDDCMREKLKNTFGATSCDMETAAIAYVCTTFSVPFGCVRKISDDAGNDAADLYRESNAQNDGQLIDIVIKAIKRAIDR